MITNQWTRMLAYAGLAVAVSLGACNLAAQQQNQQNRQDRQDRQGRPNFDPAQMQQRMMERYRERLEVTKDDEWKALEPMIQKVNEARMEVGFGGMGRGMMGRPPGAGGNDRQQGDQAQGQGGRRGFGQQSGPEAEALQKAIDAKAPAAELKAAIAKFRDARKAKEAKLAAAQDELRKVLTVRQEAVAVVMGLLN